VADMRAICLDFEALDRLKWHAEGHPIMAERFERMRNGLEGPIGEDRNHTLELPGGLRIVLSLEEQPKGMARHASFSVYPREPGALPNNTLVEAVLLPALGFKKPLCESDAVWIEGDVAVNVLQLEGESKGADE